MRKIFFLTTAAGLALAGVAVNAESGRDRVALAVRAEAGKAGLPGQFAPIKADSRLYDYCAKGLDHMRKGKAFPSSTSFSAEDCVNIFVSASLTEPSDIMPAEPGQPGRGGDGGGIAGMPGGKGGAAGHPGQDGAGLPGAPGGKGGAAGRAGGSDIAVDEDLLDYCSAMLQRPRPGPAGAIPPAQFDKYSPSDCMDYFASLDAPKASGTDASARDGAAGLSIGGGQGGEGGKRGGGPGGASGGAGGAGVGGGTGGKGGAGGSGY